MQKSIPGYLKSERQNFKKNREKIQDNWFIIWGAWKFLFFLKNTEKSDKYNS